MKNFLILAIVLVIFAPGLALSASMEELTTIVVTVPSSGSYSGTHSSTGYYDFKGCDGYVSFLVSVSGAGTATGTYLVSNIPKGSVSEATWQASFYEPESVIAASTDMLPAIVTGDGTIAIGFQPLAFRYFKFKFVETSGNDTVLTMYPSIK